MEAGLQKTQKTQKTPAKSASQIKPAAVPPQKNKGCGPGCEKAKGTSALRSPYLASFDASFGQTSKRTGKAEKTDNTCKAEQGSESQGRSAVRENSSACACQNVVAAKEPKELGQVSATNANALSNAPSNAPAAPFLSAPIPNAMDWSSILRMVSSQIERMMGSFVASQAAAAPAAAAPPRPMPPGGGACPRNPAFMGSGDLDLVFGQDAFALTPLHSTMLDIHSQLWVLRGMRDNLHIDGYASVEGGAEYNMALSCRRAQSVRTELERLGIPPTKLSTMAHGETTGFSAAALEPNRRAVMKRLPGVGPVVTIDATPVDNFAGRSRTMLGLREIAMLRYRATPSIRAAERLGLRWALLQGGDTVVGTSVLGAYRAPATPGIAVVALQVAGGLAFGTNLAMYPFVTIAPSGSLMVQRPGTNIYHHQGWASVGFQGHMYMRPTIVSFAQLEWREGDGNAIAWGIAAGSNGNPHPIGPTIPVGTGNLATGSQVLGADCVGNWPSVPASILGIPDWRGGFVWPIKWQYRTAGLGWTTYMIAYHVFASDFFGTATISKAGAGPFVRALNAGTSLLGGCAMMP